MSSSKELRQQFLEHFRAHGHTIVPSSPLVPGNDPTLLFTNAGMVQFKDVFLGADPRDYSRATTSQRCVRAGGKHNDLENVGYTARHHTFFEMLGNFSFGDYFKREAIEFCWELLTERFGLPADRLWVTVYKDDDEAADIWFNHIGIDQKKFTRCGEKDNFWSMGDTGPCGPCSEVFYDHGPGIPGGPPGSPEEDADRYIELWNLVFMQFNRDAQGNLRPLPRPSIDTGMGLERLAAVMQGVHSNYETDLFQALIGSAAEISSAADSQHKSLRVIADHIRSCAFMVVDGVVPANEGRGYVLRRIIRRAIRHGHKLGVREPFFYRMVESLDAQMGDAYPELSQRRDMVERVLLQEEERFAETLDQGMRIFDQTVAGLDGKTIPGEAVFRLYDTYGFPADLTADVARERGLEIDMAQFDTQMAAQRDRARASSQFEVVVDDALVIDGESEFVGYESLVGSAEVIALLAEGVPVDTLQAEDNGMVVLSRTPFYAESGGQVGDAGVLEAQGIRFETADTQRHGNAIIHLGVLTDGVLKLGQQLKARVDPNIRLATARNHSATHLLHAALRQVLGEHVAQKGSLVAADRLRFDFSHFEGVRKAQLDTVEQQVNSWIRGNACAETKIMRLEEAKASGAIALFGEKYTDPVRVLTVGDYSTELCGGTHVNRAGDIGLFKIITETGVAAGVRRVVALTGERAMAWMAETVGTLERVSSLLKSDRETVVEKVEHMLNRSRELERELERLKGRLAVSHGDDLAAQAVDIDGLKVLAVRVDGIDAKGLRAAVDQLKNKLGSAAIVLATVSGEKVSLVAGVTPDYVERIEAGKLANFVAQQVGGGGGGRADMAQAGGSDPSGLDGAMGSVPNWIRERLAV